MEIIRRLTARQAATCIVVLANKLFNELKDVYETEYRAIEAAVSKVYEYGGQMTIYEPKLDGIQDIIKSAFKHIGGETMELDESLILSCSYFHRNTPDEELPELTIEYNDLIGNAMEQYEEEQERIKAEAEKIAEAIRILDKMPIKNDRLDVLKFIYQYRARQGQWQWFTMYDAYNMGYMDGKQDERERRREAITA